MQYESNGRTVSEREMRPGDLLFFKGKESPKVSHVAMYLGDHLMVHASASRGVVAVEPIAVLENILVGVKRIARDENENRRAHHA